MKKSVNSLTGSQLDWAVVVANGQKADYWLEMYISEERRRFCSRASIDWAQGGPIIERERLEVKPTYAGWAAFLGNSIFCNGSTPLIAAMRCFVASKLGDEVEIPKELLD